jgi:hypothetical protein
LASDWTCPYCNRDCTITGENVQRQRSSFDLRNYLNGLVVIETKAIVCPNPACRRFTVAIEIWAALGSDSKAPAKLPILERRLLPESDAKPIPPYVPETIRSDYIEACRIREASPKASATLARRCLQGMIRDYWGISKRRLRDEIDAIKDKVDPRTWDGIEAVRQMGNIGAHMERDINTIIDVDPDEARQLIDLIELLIEDWYVIRYEREQRLKKLIELPGTKHPSSELDEPTP